MHIAYGFVFLIEVEQMTGYQIKRSFKMTSRASPEQVFPLLCPIREYDWIESWQCEMIYSDSGFAEPGCIFKTSFSADGPEDTWVVSRYEKPVVIEFVRVNPLRVIRYTITLSRAENGGTEADWAQVITGIGEEGKQFVRNLDDEGFHAHMAMVEKMLDHYLMTGAMLRTS
jgi:hypothetical protein